VSESHENLEAELSRLRPGALPQSLIARIGAEIERADAPPARLRWPDRMLLSAIGSGALAACVIVAMLLNNGGRGSSSPAAPLVTASPATAGVPLAFARADGDLFNPWK